MTVDLNVHKVSKVVIGTSEGSASGTPFREITVMNEAGESILVLSLWSSNNSAVVVEVE